VSDFGGATAGGTGVRAARQESPGTFDPARRTLTDQRILQIEGTDFRVLDRNGNTLIHGKLVEPGSYAGASQDGARFAIQSSYGEGDPVFLVYEYFTIYSSDSGAAVATIRVKNLPEHQSWSAFSPDGKYFVVGGPNELAMYRLPYAQIKSYCFHICSSNDDRTSLRKPASLSS
jgi:hypothetical protein